ncbi:MAG: hypothetical protein HRU34_00370 [Richelia sp.]|nr:hypothetical protein [Richelia sp.]
MQRNLRGELDLGVTRYTTRKRIIMGSVPLKFRGKLFASIRLYQTLILGMRQLFLLNLGIL